MVGRAKTPAQKRAVIERILAAWERVPELRLGQMIIAFAQRCEVSRSATFAAQTVFAIEDEELVARVERCVKERAE